MFVRFYPSLIALYHQIIVPMTADQLWHLFINKSYSLVELLVGFFMSDACYAVNCWKK